MNDPLHPEIRTLRERLEEERAALFTREVRAAPRHAVPAQRRRRQRPAAEASFG